MNRIEEISNKLIYEINQFNEIVKHLQSHEEKMKKEKFTVNPNDSEEKQLKKREGYYDRMHESFCLNDQIIVGEGRLKKAFNDLLMLMSPQVGKSKHEKETIGNQLNEMLDEMREKEKKLKKGKMNEEDEEMNYEKWYVETEEYKRRRNEREEQMRRQKELEEAVKRNKIVMDCLTKEEMVIIEKEVGRYVDWKLFDSTVDKWSKGNSWFDWKIMHHSHFVVLIETREGKKFGSYIEGEVEERGKYIVDKNAFIFKFENGRMEKYPVIDMKKSFKILSEKDENMFIVGNKDIVIKKEDNKNKCSCRQSSFDYHGEVNILIGRTGEFEVKSFVVIQMKLTEEEKQIMMNGKEMKQLEEWTNLKCSNILFDSDVDNWTDQKVFN